MRTTNGINTEEKWKEALEEWAPDVEVTGWEDVAGRIPSGRAFRVRQRIEGGAVRVARAVARFVSVKMVAVAIASAILSGYVTYRVVERKIEVKEAKVQVLDNPLSQSPKSLDVPTANGNGKHNGRGDVLAQTARGKQSESSAAPSDPSRYLGVFSTVNGLSSASNRNISEGGSGNANAASGSSSRVSRNDINKAVASKDRKAYSSIASVSSYLGEEPRTLARHSGKSSVQDVLQDSASRTTDVLAAASKGADAVKSRRWIKRRNIAERKTGSKLKHRALPDPAPSSGIAEVDVEPLNQPQGSSFAKRELPEAPIGRGRTSLQKFHLNPSWSNGSFLTLEYPAVHVPFTRYLSYFWGVSLDAGAARSGSSTLVFAGANAFVGSMYKEKVGLMLSVGGRWLGNLPSTLQVDSNSDISIPEIDPDSSKHSSSLQSYYQAIFGLDGVVRLYSGSKASFSTTLGGRGCFTQRVKGDSTSKRIVPLSAVRFSANYRRRASVGTISLSQFAEYQLNGAGLISKSSILFGINVGVIF